MNYMSDFDSQLEFLSNNYTKIGYLGWKEMLQNHLQEEEETRSKALALLQQQIDAGLDPLPVVPRKDNELPFPFMMRRLRKNYIPELVDSMCLPLVVIIITDFFRTQKREGLNFHG
jgi:hypothetical protein